MATNNSLQTLVSGADLITKLMGGKSTQTSTSSTQSNISQEGVDRLVQQILAGRGGVKDIAGAARGAGLYNGSTEAQMLNDLAARTAGEVEARRAGTTTTQETTTQTPGMDLGTVGLGLGALALGKPILEKALGLGSQALGLTGNASMASQGLTGVSPSVNLAASNASTISPTWNGLSMLGSAIPGFQIGGDLLQGSGALLGAGSGAAGLASDLGLSVAGNAGSVAVDQGLSSLIPGAGSFLSGLFGAQNGDPFGSPLGFLSSMGGGAMAMGPYGMIAAPVLGLAGSMLSDLGLKSIVCTALMKHGLIDKDEYAKGQAYLQTLSQFTLLGYYSWGRKLAAKIDQGDKKTIKMCLPWARSRTKLIADESKFVKYFKYPLGTLTLVVGQPLCWLLGTLLYIDGVTDNG